MENLNIKWISKLLNLHIILIQLNHFCMNYDKGTLDIFLNNKLIASKPGIVPYTTTDVISCGSAGGIEGGICNIRYYTEPVSSNHMCKSSFSYCKRNAAPAGSYCIRVL